MPTFATGDTLIDLRPGAHDVFRTKDGAPVKVKAELGAQILLNDKPVPTVRAEGHEHAVVELPTEPAMGAVRLEVRTPAWTARLDVVTPIVEVTRDRLCPAMELVRTQLPRSRGVFWYRSATGEVRRYFDPLTIAVFLADAESLIRGRLATVRMSPSWRRHSAPRRQPFAGAVRVHDTVRLLTSRPELLHRRADGKLRPSLVVEGVPIRHHASPENRQLVAFLRRLLIDTSPSNLEVAALPVDLHSAILRVRDEIGAALATPPLAAVEPESLSGPTDPPRGREEGLAGYRDLAQLRRQYLQHTSASDADPFHRDFLPSPDDVYEAYVAEMVAAAFSMEPVGAGLRDRSDGPSYVAPDWELWFDLSTSVPSWRRATSRPDRYRPDVVLRSTASSGVIVADAKYSFRSSADDDGPGKGAPGARIKEVQAYLDAFGLKSIAIIHPGQSPKGSLCVEDIAANGHLIRQIELNAVEASQLQSLLPELRRALEGVSVVPNLIVAEANS